ncbi:MAG: hypothetical protein P8186_24465 [Anaerolineae bacterium]|jgi:hypothetical protein
MYDDQDRPPWLRDLRPARPKTEPESYPAAPHVSEPDVEPGLTEVAVESPTEDRGALNRRQMLLLALLLWGNVTVLGCLCLLATQVVVP